MKNIELSIPDMQSAHCQARVNGAISGIEGVKIQNIEAGKLSVSVDAVDVEERLISAIEKAGYKVADNGNNASSSCSTGCCGN